MDYSRKNPNRGDWGHGIFRRTEDKACRNFRGKLTNKRNFQGFSRKNYVELPWVLIFDLKGCNTTLLNFHRWKLVFSGISRGKMTNLKFPGRHFSENVSWDPSLVFFWNSPLNISNPIENVLLQYLFAYIFFFTLLLTKGKTDQNSTCTQKQVLSQVQACISIKYISYKLINHIK